MSLSRRMNAKSNDNNRLNVFAQNWSNLFLLCFQAIFTFDIFCIALQHFPFPQSSSGARIWSTVRYTRAAPCALLFVAP
jgi:hypothetical protein